jgi:hypothetical protein
VQSHGLLTFGVALFILVSFALVIVGRWLGKSRLT